MVYLVVEAGNSDPAVSTRSKPMDTPAIPFEYDDGGRRAAGFKGNAAGDCAARAVAIATGKPYREVYDEINRLAKAHERRSKRKRGVSDARTGVYRVTMHRLMDSLGAEWVPTMSIGSGCTVHVRADELPGGRLVLNLSKHYAAVVDGVLRDSHDCSRDGTRCVYGFWRIPGPQ
jgi:hypothetical protein